MANKSGRFVIIAILGSSLLLLAIILFIRSAAGPGSSDASEGYTSGDTASLNTQIITGPGADSLNNSRSVLEETPVMLENIPDSQAGNGESVAIAANADNDQVNDPVEAPQKAKENPESEARQLSQHVFEVITEVQTRQLDGQWEEALNEMNALYKNFDNLNSFEQATLLNFYTNTLLQLEMLQESITAFSQMLTIQDLSPDVNARALVALGQLHNQQGEYAQSISYLEYWLEFTSDMDSMQAQRPRVIQLLEEARGSLQQRELQ